MAERAQSSQLIDWNVARPFVVRYMHFIMLHTIKYLFRKIFCQFDRVERNLKPQPNSQIGSIDSEQFLFQAKSVARHE